MLSHNANSILGVSHAAANAKAIYFGDTPIWTRTTLDAPGIPPNFAVEIVPVEGTTPGIPPNFAVEIVPVN